MRTTFEDISMDKIIHVNYDILLAGPNKSQGKRPHTLRANLSMNCVLGYQGMIH